MPCPVSSVRVASGFVYWLAAPSPVMSAPGGISWDRHTRRLGGPGSPAGIRRPHPSNFAHPPTSCGTFCLGPTAPLSTYYYNDSTIAQQYIVRKRVGPMGPVPAAATAGASSGGGEGRGGGGGGGGPEPEPVTNGSGQGGGLGALLRGRTKQAEPAAVGANTRTRRSTAPPPPPRKKKKRSGRRR